MGRKASCGVCCVPESELWSVWWAGKRAVECVVGRKASIGVCGGPESEPGVCGGPESEPGVCGGPESELWSVCWPGVWGVGGGGEQSSK